MAKKCKNIMKLIIIALVIIIAIFIANKLSKKAPTEEPDVLVDAELSTNYLNGYKISENKEYNFSVTNNGDKDIYYDILIDNLKNYESNISYSLISNDANISIINAKIIDSNNVISKNIHIPSKSTQNFTFRISNNNITTFNLNIKKVTETEEYFSNIIMENNKISKSPISSVGKDIATGNEGLIENTDDYGTTYYFRGNVTNNYVNFAGKTWRIVRINGDGTVKLILDEVAKNLANYHNTYNKFSDLEHASINDSLNTFYTENLKEYDSYIAVTKYCVESGYNEVTNEKIFNGYSRVITNEIPNFSCFGDTYNNKIGLLTVDEVAFAGANFKDNNTSYYLYNSSINNIWWTSTIAKASKSYFYPFSVNKDGKITYNNAGTLYRNLRPTINLIKKVTVSGEGTKDKPYYIETK